MPILTIPPRCRLFPKEISRLNRTWRRENVTSCRERIRSSSTTQLLPSTVSKFHHEQCIRSLLIFTCALFWVWLLEGSRNVASHSLHPYSAPSHPSHPNTLNPNSVLIASPHFSSRHYSSFKNPSQHITCLAVATVSIFKPHPFSHTYISPIPSPQTSHPQQFPQHVFDRAISSHSDLCCCAIRASRTLAIGAEVDLNGDVSEPTLALEIGQQAPKEHGTIRKLTHSHT